MQTINAAIAGQQVTIEVEREERGGHMVFVATWAADRAVRAVSEDSRVAVSNLQDRIATLLTPPKVAPALVLVVEDEPGCAAIARMVCEMDGHSVVEAQNGVEALVQLRSRSFDLVLADIHMPALDGLVLARRISGDVGQRPVPVIAVTAAAPALHPQLLAAGVVAIVTKPYTPDDLRGAVARTLAKRRPVQAG